MTFGRVGFTCGILLLTAAAAHAQPLLDSDKEIAEKTVLDDVCSPPSPANLRRIGRVAFPSEKGVQCVSSLLQSISLSAVASDPTLIAGSDLLWSLVDLAEVSQPARDLARPIFVALALDVEHPLRSEAWLALRALEKAGGTFKPIEGRLSYAYIPAPHLANLLPDDMRQLKSRIERMHPTLRREVGWALAQMVREFVATAPESPPLAKVAQLAVMIGTYSNATTDLAMSMVDAFLEDKKLYTSDQAAKGVGSDILPPMEFTLTGTACADGGNCQSLESTATNLTNWRKDATRGFNPDPSWSSVHINFLNTLQNPPNTFVLANYSGAIQSNIRGGYWREKILDVVTKTGNGTSSVNYTLQGVAKIPRCTDTSQCSPTVTVWVNAYPGDAAKGAALTLTVDGPTGKRDLPLGGFVQIDRTLGEYKIEAVLSRSASRTGGCCHEWVPQSFVVSISKMGGPPPLFVSVSDSGAGIGALTLPPWLDVEVYSDLATFSVVAGRMLPRISSNSGMPPLDFASQLSQTSTAYERRYTSIWPKLIFSRLAIEWGGNTLSPTEKNQLAAINATVTSQARFNLTGALQAELSAYAFALESLDQTPLLLVMAALVRDTDITEAVNGAEVELVNRIAAASGKSSPVGDSLKEAKAALDFVRASSSKVDSLLRLSAAEQLMGRRARYAKVRYDRLARELAQLWAK